MAFVVSLRLSEVYQWRSGIEGFTEKSVESLATGKILVMWLLCFVQLRFHNSATPAQDSVGIPSLLLGRASRDGRGGRRYIVDFY